MSQKRILETLSKNLNSYQSTCWLKTENAKLNGATPAELMMENKTDKAKTIWNMEVNFGIQNKNVTYHILVFLVS